jgi:hypothetical protein
MAASPLVTTAVDDSLIVETVDNNEMLQTLLLMTVDSSSTILLIGVEIVVGFSTDTMLLLIVLRLSKPLYAK